MSMVTTAPFPMIIEHLGKKQGAPAHVGSGFDDEIRFDSLTIS